MTICVKYFSYNAGMMTSAEIENLINEHNERVRQERNELLRARLARPCSSEELLLKLGDLSERIRPRGERQIPLTNTCAQYII